MKTPFNNEAEPFFNREGLYRLDFVEHEGKIVAFDMRALKEGKPIDASNSVSVCDTQAILPEALEFILSTPLQYKTNVAASRMLTKLESVITQAYIQTNMKVFAKMLTDVRNINAMLAAAEEIPVIGRAASMNKRRIIDG